jgi:uncharacterized protein (DUF58 family)
MQTSKAILLRAKRQIFTEKIGNNLSRFKGEGYDFAELREYVSGDDVRHIDWVITAKMGTPYVKEFHQQRELNVILATMLSGSVYFGTKVLKQEQIANIVALLGLSAIKNGDPITSYLFSDELIQRNQPSKHYFSVEKVVNDILNYDPIGKAASYKAMINTLYTQTKKRSLIIVIADFFEPVDLKLLATKHEVIAIIVRDHFEENPKPLGFSALKDLESGTMLEAHISKSSVDHYAKKVREHDTQLLASLQNSGVRFVKIYTDDTPYVKLRELFF